MPAEVLKPRNTWKDPAAYDAQARKLARMFVDNFKAFESRCAPRTSGRRAPRSCMPFEPVIGLEIHAQLLTPSKIFCGCSTTFGAPPNTNICPGLPRAARRAAGPQPRAPSSSRSRRRSRSAARSTQTSIFARKNYFYPDLPKGYQISQYDRPLATGGVARVRDARRRAARRHHPRPPGGGRRQVAPRRLRRTRTARPTLDFNRSGVPLIEIVTEPDLRSAADAGECFSRLRAILVALGVNDGNMEEGSLRCDANVSVRRGRRRRSA